MATVSVRINGRDYQIACDDGQEEHLRLLADEIDDRVRSLVFNMGANPGEAVALMMTALTMADELIEVKTENEKLLTEVDMLAGQVSEENRLSHESRMMEMETAMAVTLEEIAHRIEKIAEQIELR